MSNKIGNNEIELIIAAMQDLKTDIKDLRDDMTNSIKDFKSDAHDKIDTVENSLNKKIKEIKDKISSIEQTNKRIEGHEIEIIRIKNDINELANMTRKHRDEHKELVDNEINDVIKSFKAGFVTKLLLWISAPTTILLILGKITGFLDKIIIGFTK